jgi:hypothetical protein
MDIALLASGLIAARMGEIQLAVAARQNGQQLADAAAGLGGNVDISV